MAAPDLPPSESNSCRDSDARKTIEGEIAIVGLGYVGLPLAVSFAKHLPVLGFGHQYAPRGRTSTGRLRRRSLIQHPFQKALPHVTGFFNHKSWRVSCSNEVAVRSVPTRRWRHGRMAEQDGG